MDTFNYVFNLKELLLLFAVLQAVFLIIVLIRVPTRNPLPNRLFSLLLLCLAAMLLEYIWVYAGGFRRFPRLLGFSLLSALAISPVYYFYAQSLLGEQLDWRGGLHLLPAGLGLAFLIPTYLEPSANKVAWMEAVMGSGLAVFPTLGILFASYISLNMLAYFYFTYTLVENYETKLKEESADARVLTIGWLKTLSMAACVFGCLYYLSAIHYLMIPVGRDLLPDVLAFATAGVILWLAYHGYRQPDLFALYQPGSLPSAKTLEARPKYQNTQLPPEQINAYKAALLTLMEDDKPYLDGDLRLAKLADMLGIPPHHLSQVINVAFKQSFFDFVNAYRSRHAQGLLRQSGDRANVLDVALASGFNSKASFNRVFKQETGLTPTEFLSNLAN